jgi:hypothetical protein
MVLTLMFHKRTNLRSQKAEHLVQLNQGLCLKLSLITIAIRSLSFEVFFDLFDS